jgi:hypothetical protein
MVSRFTQRPGQKEVNLLQAEMNDEKRTVAQA